MGREIRRVPPGWEHPRQNCHHSPWAGGCDEAKRGGGKCYQPVYDRDVESEWREYLQKWTEWIGGEFDRVRADYPDLGYDAAQPYRAFYEWDSGSSPDPAYYHPAWTKEECTAYQMYETVSEGTPVSPVFETPEGLVDYLVNHGDFWDQRRGEGGWAREHAEKFVKTGWAMSMVAIPDGQGGYETKTARDGA